MAGLRGLGNAPYRRVLGGGVVLGDDDHRRRQRQADQGTEVKRHRLRTEQGGGNRIERRCRNHAGHDHAAVQRAHDLAALASLDKERADDRRNDRHRAQQQRIQHRIHAERLHGQPGQQHGGDHRDRIGLEQIGRHAGAVTDVVTDVVGNHRRIARIVLGNARLDLAHQIGPDVGALGEDAAAQARKNRDQRTAEGQPHQRMQRMVGAGHLQHDQVVAGHAQQTQPDHQQPGHRATAKCHLQRRIQAQAGGMRRTHVGTHRDVHADETGETRKHRADRETAGSGPVEGDAEQQEQHYADHADGGVLTVQVSLRAGLDGRRNLLHALVTGRLRHDPAHHRQAIHDGQRTGTNGQPQSKIRRHTFLPLSVERTHSGNPQFFTTFLCDVTGSRSRSS